MDGNLSTMELLRFMVILHNRDTKCKEEVTVFGVVDFHAQKQYDKTPAMWFNLQLIVLLTEYNYIVCFTHSCRSH